LWQAIDAYGQIVGEAKISFGEGYDVTQCYEYSLKTTRGSQGTGIYVSKLGNWKAGSSTQWVPSNVQRKNLDVLLMQIGRTIKPLSEKGDAAREKKLDRHILFFKSKSENADGGETVDYHAVVGGRFLAIVALTEAGKWVLNYLSLDFANMDYLPSEGPYVPLAVFDMDLDGSPEIIVHTTEGPSWQDIVLRQFFNGWAWEQAAMSVGGATL